MFSCSACDRPLVGQVADRLRKIGLEIGAIARLQALRRELSRNAPAQCRKVISRPRGEQSAEPVEQ
jgi:nucleoside diphosphate kinase